MNLWNNLQTPAIFFPRFANFNDTYQATDRSCPKHAEYLSIRRQVTTKGANCHARSVRATKIELRPSLAQHCVDVGVITEIQLSPKVSFPKTIPKYIIVRLDHPDSSDGVRTVIVKKGIRYEILGVRGSTSSTHRGNASTMAAPPSCSPKSYINSPVVLDM